MATGAKRRKRLFKENPFCVYCGIKTILLPNKGRRGKKWQPNNLATIEHIYTRFDPRRRTPNVNNERRHVLACYKCNHEKGQEAHALYSKFEDAMGPRNWVSWGKSWLMDLSRVDNW